MSLDPELERRREIVQRAMSVAALHRRRGDYEEAWRALDDALAVHPEDASVMEMMGDLNADEGEWDAAAQCYRRALQWEPGRPRAEEGLALASLRLAEGTGLFGGDVASVEGTVLAKRQPQQAAIASLFVPGLGQGYAGEAEAGAAFFVAWFFVWGLALWQWSGALHKRASLARITADAGPLFWLALVLLAVIHLWAAFDAYRRLSELKQGDG